MIKKRKRCVICRAKKYVQYLSREITHTNPPKEFYICRNGSKCIRRGANYKK